MTMPHLMNCEHSDEGWCLDCVKKLHDQLEPLRVKELQLAKLCDEVVFMVNEWDNMQKLVKHYKSQAIELAAFACRWQHPADDIPPEITEEARGLMDKWTNIPLNNR